MAMSLEIFIIIHAVFSLLSPNAAGSPQVRFGYSSPTVTDFYLGQQILFTCTTQGFTNLTEFGIYYQPGKVGNNWRSACAGGLNKAAYGCESVDENWHKILSCNLGQLGGLRQLSTVSNNTCNNIGRKEGFTIELRVIFTNASLDGKFYCEAKGFVGLYLRRILNSGYIYLDNLKVAPRRLEMSIDPKEPVEGMEFSFTCTSEEGHPTSRFVYSINGKDAISNRYTPERNDRDGINVSCTDTKHQYWKGGNTHKYRLVVPKYLEVVAEHEISLHLLRDLTSFKLSCSEYVAGNPEPTTFKWKRRGVINNVSSSSLVLTPLLTSTTERIDCEVENGIGKNVIISWYITWSLNKDFLEESLTASQPEESTTKTPLQSEPLFIGSLAGSAVLIVIIVIVIAFCCRWKNRVIHRPLPPVPQFTTSHRELQKQQSNLPTPLRPATNEDCDVEDYLNPTPSEYFDLIQSGKVNADHNYESLL